MDGDSLIYEEPPEEVPIYIPDAELIPVWIDPDVDYIPSELTYVDGELVNLYLINISGNKTVADIDLDGDGYLPKHEILVYFAKYVSQNIQTPEFERNYRIQSKYLFQARPGINKTEMYAAPQPHMIFYQPAFYSMRFLNIEVELLERTSNLGTQSF